VTFASKWKRRALVSAVACGVLWPAAQPSAAPQAGSDNTKVNARDRQKTQKTADQQNNNRVDLEITRQIRKAIIADKSLSTNAHNIKIITTDGVVTLKGPVRTDAEKSAVEKMAAEVAGATKVKSQISVPDSPGSTHRKPATKKVSHPKTKVSQ
jgi:hyperosmotically inducible periplasmic protein